MPISAVPLLAGQAPIPGPAIPGQAGIYGCYSPIAFAGLGMQIGPFTFPWLLTTMPSSTSAAAAANQAQYNAAIGLPNSGPVETVCTGSAGDVNNVNGKLCTVWTTVVSDWTQLPIDLAAHLQQILLSDIEGGGHGFGNFWNFQTWLPSADPQATTHIPGVNPSVGQPVTLASYREWITALGIGPDQNYYLNFIPVQGNDLVTYGGPTYPGAWYQGVPITQFDHPDKVSGRYGIWLALEQTGGPNTELVLRIIVDSVADAQSRLPQASTWSKILHDLNPLNWPGMLLDAIEAVGHDLASLMSGLYDAAGNLICDVASNPILVSTAITATAASQGIPPAKSAGAANNIASIAQQKCAAPPPDCTLPANAGLTQCLPVLPPLTPATPWWQQWYVLVPAVALVGYLLLKPDDGTS